MTPAAPPSRRASLIAGALARRQFVVAAGAVLFLGGCGGGSDDGAGGVVTLTDAMGPVSAPERPDRVVADSVSTMAHLWALGIVPIGAALPTGISPEYIDADADDVANLVADDGWTLNVEGTLAARPDLIVAIGADYNEENCERYKAALPTYCFRAGDDSEESVTTAFREIAAAVGRQEEADEAIAAYERRRDALAARVAAAGLGDRRAGIVRFDSGGFIGVRVDGAQTLLEALGFRAPEWPAVGPSGYVELSLENLSVLNAADILLVTLDDDVDPEKVPALRSPLWDRLRPVASGNAHVVSAWNGSDLPQLERILDEVESAVVAPAEGAVTEPTATAG